MGHRDVTSCFSLEDSRPPFLPLYRLPFEEEGTGLQTNSSSVTRAEPEEQSCAPPWHSAQGKCPSGFFLVMALPKQMPQLQALSFPALNELLNKMMQLNQILESRNQKTLE